MVSWGVAAGDDEKESDGNDRRGCGQGDIRSGKDVVGGVHGEAVVDGAGDLRGVSKVLGACPDSVAAEVNDGKTSVEISTHLFPSKVLRGRRVKRTTGRQRLPTLSRR